MNEALDRIDGHLAKLRQPTTKRGFRLMHLRLIIRLAQDEYDRELHELESLNSVQADPALHTEIVG